MKWYYVENAQQRGPVTDADLEQLVSAGTVQPATLVWQEGMADWQPYSQVMASGGASAPASTAPPPEGSVVCSQCGNIFPPDEVIRYGDAAVCAQCKPVFVQRLREGAATSVSMEYAGFWIRFLAKIVDQIVLSVVGGIMGGIVGAIFAATGGDQPVAMAGVIYAMNVLAAMAYTVFFLYRFGATPGKMLLKIRVVRADGDHLSLGRCFGRYFAEILSGLICGIGYIMAAFDDEKRALHDRICDTRVIKR